MSHTAATLRLLQLTDSSFPTGGFSLSHGLEGLFALGLISGEEDIRDVAGVHIEETLACQDLPAVSWSHQYASESNLEALVDLDLLLTALKTVPVFRRASTRVGRQTLEAAYPMFPSAFSRSVLDAVQRGDMSGHHAITFGVSTWAAGIARTDAVAGFGASSLSSYVAAAVRLGIIGQIAAQRIIARLETPLSIAIESAPEIRLSDFGGYTPLIDIAGMRQPALSTRMFAS